MENAANALEIVFGILIFVLALSITMSMFSETTQSFQAIVNIKESAQQYLDMGSQASIDNGRNRIVGIETLLPMMYRAYKENFEIRIYNSSVSLLPLLYDEDGHYYYVDLIRENYANNMIAVNGLENKLNTGLYNSLKNMTFTEKLGEYYQDDVDGTNEDVADINKTKKRVVVYIAN